MSEDAAGVGTSVVATTVVIAGVGSSVVEGAGLIVGVTKVGLSVVEDIVGDSVEAGLLVVTVPPVEGAGVVEGPVEGDVVVVATEGLPETAGLAETGIGLTVGYEEKTEPTGVGAEVVVVLVVGCAGAGVGAAGSSVGGLFVGVGAGGVGVPLVGDGATEGEEGAGTSPEGAVGADGGDGEATGLLGGPGAGGGGGDGGGGGGGGGPVAEFDGGDAEGPVWLEGEAGCVGEGDGLDDWLGDG